MTIFMDWKDLVGLGALALIITAYVVLKLIIVISDRRKAK